MFLLNELDSTLSAYAYNAPLGRLGQLLVTLTTLPPGTPPPAPNATSEYGAGEVHTSADGRFVYASNRGPTSSIVVFEVVEDPVSYMLNLSYVGAETGGGDVQWPRDFDLDPSGNWLLVANERGGSTTLFAVNRTTGMLTKVNTSATNPGPQFVGWRPVGFSK